MHIDTTPYHTLSAANDVPQQALAAAGSGAKKPLDFHGEAAARFVWRGRNSLAKVSQPVLSSGFSDIDTKLPGGGWPLHTFNEWLTPGHSEWTLLKPVLAQISARGESVMCISPPHNLYAPGLLQAGIDLRTLYVVQASAKKGADLWAAEQALRAGCLGAVVIFSRSADQQSLRRIKLACESHAGFCVLIRDAAAAPISSPASVRARLHVQPDKPGTLGVEFLKLRGAASGQSAWASYGVC
jgi:protein ImuA